jgi:pimeloyl-ACP methyl ester carboxylesterase
MGAPPEYGAGSSDGLWLQTDWAQHRRTMRLRDREVVYVDMGPEAPTGEETLVFIHGLGACWQTWLEQLPRFARTHRCIAMDLPGFGRSEMPRDAISMEMYGELLSEMLVDLGIERATVIGNSMGGFIGCELAIKRPEVVERLVLVSAAVFWQEYRRAKPLMTLARLTEASASRAIVNGQKLMRTRPRTRAAALMLGGFRHPQRLAREMQVELLLHAKRTDGFVPALLSFGDYPLREELATIRCPTLIVWGSEDTLESVAHAHDLGDIIEGSRKVIFEGCGHVGMVEMPGPFNAALEEFLQVPAAAAAASSSEPAAA